MKEASWRLSGSSRSISTSSRVNPFRGAPIHFAALILIIEREIGVLLEDADLPHLLGADPAGGDVRHAAILETEPRIRDVFAAAQDRHADGVDRLHGRTDEMQNDFEIVDHQVEHDSDIGAAIRIRRKPMRLDEARIRQAFFQRAQDRIETLHVADLQDEPARRGELRQFARVRGVFRDRFFDQEMLAPGQQFARDLEMRVRRRRDRGGVHLFRKLFEGSGGHDAKFLGHAGARVA